MHKIFTLFVLLLSINYITAQTSAIGLWQAVDDKDGEPSSHIEIYEVEGKLHAKVVKLLQEEPDLLCEKCKGDKKNKPVVGMEIMWGMKPEKDPMKWKGGKIMDPENGKEYKCKVKLAEEDVLEVRGFVGFSLLGRTQKWHRVKE